MDEERRREIDRKIDHLAEELKQRAKLREYGKIGVILTLHGAVITQIEYVDQERVSVS